MNELLWRICLFPWTAPLLAVVVLALALPLATRFRRPRRFCGGAFCVAMALATLWPFQYVASLVDSRFWEWNMLAHLAGIFVTICLLTGGLEAMRRANNTPEDESWEFLR